MRKMLIMLLSVILVLSAVGCSQTPPEVPEVSDVPEVPGVPNDTDNPTETNGAEGQLLDYDNYKEIMADIYLCDDVYRSKDTPTHGTASIRLPMAQDVLELKDYDIFLCGDGCDPAAVVSRASQGYAPVYRIVSNGEIDGNSKVLKFKMEIPEPMLEDIKKQGAYEQITEQLESKYFYLLVLDEKHYAYIHLARIDGAEKTENEAELADSIVKNARIIFEPDNEKINLTIERVIRLAENKGENLTWSDFEMYSGRDIGSGLYILNYEIDETFDLMVGGVPGTEPMYIRLVTKADRDKYIDIRTEDVEKFISKNREENFSSETGSDANQPERITAELPDDFVFPITDGSTSTTNLDKAVRNAILGGEQTVAHTKTYTSFDNLLNEKCQLIFTTPLSDTQLKTMQDKGFRHEAEPVAGEGFVFVVNKDNPVDTLTIEQIKGIYSGEITNWKEVGGNDAEIIAYQRNADSGSQNYMISFMGDTPLMKPVTDQIPASMSGILDVIAGYDNGIDAIGYSVYAYSDGMYENISEIKYIKVNGVEPSLTTLADGTYPLLGYNYAVFSADEPEDSHVRTLVKWIQSDEGQQVIADAGYIPYRQVDGLTLPESTTKTLYTAKATSGIAKPEVSADYYYHCRQYVGIFADTAFDKKVQNFVTAATDELSQYDEAEIKQFLKSRAEYCYGPEIVTNYSLTNGYLSVLVGLRYNFGAQDSPDYYYDTRTAVFDIYTGEQLELSDLFFEGVDFVPLLNKLLAEKAVTPYSGFGATHDMVRDFTGLYEGEFTFTASSIIFKPGTCFADGVALSIADLSEYMVTSIPRNMTGYVKTEIPVYTQIRQFNAATVGYAEEKNGITIWYLDAEKTPVSDEVCKEVNTFIDNIYDSYFAPEKLLARVDNAGITAESVEIGPFPDFDVTVVGNRYISFNGANLAVAKNSSEPFEFSVIDNQYHPVAFNYFINAQTGEMLEVGDLFKEGWGDEAKYTVVDANYSQYDSNTWTPFTQSIDFGTSRILRIENYQAAPYNRGDLSDLDYPVTIYIITENDDKVAVSVPRSYIK